MGMTQMSKTQRTAILEAHAYRGDWRYRGIVLICHNSTLNVLRREGWMNGEYHITTAGLIAAGADMDAIHGEALEMNEPWTNRLSAEGRQAIRNAAHAEALDMQARREMDEAEAFRATPQSKHFHAAVIEGKGYRAALDILHAEALRDDVVREARAITPEPKRMLPEEAPIADHVGRRGMARRR